MDRFRRVVLALVVAVTAAAWLGVRAVPETVARVEAAEALVATRNRAIERYREQLARAPLLADSIAGLEAVVAELPDHVIPGGDRGMAGLDAVRRVTIALDGATAAVDQVLSEDVGEPGSVGGRLGRLSTRVVLTTDFAGLVDVVRRIESDPVLWVDSLAVTPDPALDAAAEPLVAAVSDAPEALHVTLTVGAWYAHS